MQGVYLMYEAIKEGTNRLPLTLSKNSSVPDPKSVGYSLEWGGYKPFYKRWARDYPVVCFVKMAPNIHTLEFPYKSSLDVNSVLMGANAGF